MTQNIPLRVQRIPLGYATWFPLFSTYWPLIRRENRRSHYILPALTPHGHVAAPLADHIRLCQARLRFIREQLDSDSGIQTLFAFTRSGLEPVRALWT